jgi:uncharacterized damage-inducible protein DinB
MTSDTGQPVSADTQEEDLVTDPRYPIGPFQAPRETGAPERSEWIEQVAAAPGALRAAVAGLGEAQLETPYREGGWVVRQVVHHTADSHVNAYTRFRLALTESEPTIRTYDEKAWALLSDARSGPVEESLSLVESVHTRWVRLLRSLSDDDFSRRFAHPEVGTMTVGSLLALYAWHGRHHAAHITSLRERLGW